MRTAALIAQMAAAVGGLLALVAIAFHGLAWAAPMVVRFMPPIGRRHRHDQWQEMTKPSVRRQQAADTPL